MLSRNLKLKFARIEKDITQKQLADLVGISRDYVAELERGRARNPSKKIRSKIADVLEKTESELFPDY